MSELTPGDGSFFEVRIEAVADPTPPEVDIHRTPEEIRREIEALCAELSSLSEQEALDEVHRQVVIFLCGPCYRVWIENPTGG